MNFIRKLSDHLSADYAKTDTAHIRQGAIHMDLWFDNMHFEGEDKITLYDFDFCGNGWLCLDISYFLYQLYNTNQEGDDYQRKAESFLKGYESITPISEEEKRWLKSACLYVMLYFLSMQCDRYDTWSNIFLNEDHLKRFIAALKRWMGFQDISID